jgi:sugar transferase (PEP-CTERM/EpsH1 system associated)
MPADNRPLIMHVVYSFRTGGLENGVVNLVNSLPEQEFRHLIVALATVDPAFAARIRRADVEVLALHKPPGQLWRLYPQLLKLMAARKPAIVHTRNLAALEVQLPAALMRVPVRIHSEHGWDVNDPHGTAAKPRWIRRFYRPYVQRYVALSRHLENYLLARVGIPQQRLSRICNGVDTERFRPAQDGRPHLSGCPWSAEEQGCVFGTVGRLQAIKDQLSLIRAFAQLHHAAGLSAGAVADRRARLVIVGDGPMRDALAAEVKALGVADAVWLTGERSDVAEVMRCFDVFVLPSLAEGISNTILEAMASGLPVIATDVGGNAELVEDGVTGCLVKPGDVRGLAAAMAHYAAAPARMRETGESARQRAVTEFSLAGMMDRYAALYREQLAGAGWRPIYEGA